MRPKFRVAGCRTGASLCRANESVVFFIVSSDGEPCERAIASAIAPCLAGVVNRLWNYRAAADLYTSDPRTGKRASDRAFGLAQKNSVSEGLRPRCEPRRAAKTGS